MSALLTSCRPLPRELVRESGLQSCLPFSCRTKVTGTELEKKIAEACSNKPWGASSTMQSEIAQSTYD